MFKFKSKEQKKNEHNFKVNVGKRMAIMNVVCSAEHTFKQVVKLNISDEKDSLIIVPVVRCRFTGLNCSMRDDCRICPVQQKKPHQREYFTNVRVKECRRMRK